MKRILIGSLTVGAALLVFHLIGLGVAAWLLPLLPLRPTDTWAEWPILLGLVFITFTVSAPIVLWWIGNEVAGENYRRNK